MSNAQKTFLPLDRLALLLPLGGVVLGVLIVIVGQCFRWQMVSRPSFNTL